jgi:hypothetical protein
VGATPQLELALAPRLNLITGDNGLGKSFLLDAAWYCLTRRWPQELNPGLYQRPRGGCRATDQAKPSQIGMTLLAWMALSWVARGSPWESAVATISRSAGSPWKLCGN